MWLFFKRIALFKEWGPYPELTAGQWEEILNILKKYTSGNTILDYGCGTGDFLNAMDRAGWDCSGIEPNEGARKQASQNKSLAQSPSSNQGLN